MDSKLPLSIIAAAGAAMFGDAERSTRKEPIGCPKSIMPKKDWNRRQARNKIAKASRKRNRA